MGMKTFISSSGSIFLVLFLHIQIAIAHGTEKHQGETGKTDHMKEMYALKESIPEDYQIMERTPIVPDEQSVQQGQKLFIQNCAVCHGEFGDGKGPAAASMSTPPANLLDKKHSAIYGPGEKYWIIGNGPGKTGMPGFSKIGSLDRWNLVNYILHLQKQITAGNKGHENH